MYLYEGRGLLLLTLLAALQVMCLRNGFVELHKTVLGLLLSFCDDAGAVICRVTCLVVGYSLPPKRLHGHFLDGCSL